MVSMPENYCELLHLCLCEKCSVMINSESVKILELHWVLSERGGNTKIMHCKLGFISLTLIQ